ncbi:MAG: patatin-like phospholipase family protein [Actinomycetota bacterium]|nr:patatin-like phospholipase family protein [Actinomycetota bacterium]
MTNRNAPAASRRRVAIACQGGGSHTAFTAGVLKRLVRDDRHEVVALSGTSGGAVCAYLTWYALASEGADRAAELLDSFWAEMAATQPWDVALNALAVTASRVEGTVALPAVSPYAFPPWPEQRLRHELDRLVSPDAVKGVTADRLLLVGAVDVRSGAFRAFSSARGEVRTDAILASAAIPNLFRAIHIDGEAYWDGLFSQNPPVRELPHAGPDAIWVVRINPAARAEELTSVPEILDRRNELAGNLSLSQELYFIEKINELVRNGALAGTKYREIAVETIGLDRDLDTASKLDRSPSFIAEMMALGEEKADAFLARLN